MFPARRVPSVEMVAMWPFTWPPRGRFTRVDFMNRKRVVLLVGIVVACAAIVVGIIAATGGFSSDSNDKQDVQARDVTPTSSLAVNPSPSTSASSAEEDQDTTGAGTSTNGSDEPVVTVFRNVHGQVGVAGTAPSAVPLEVGGEVQLVPGATVVCVAEISGVGSPMTVTIAEIAGEDDFYPFSGIGVTEAPFGEHPWTMTCTSSDGAEWSDSGTVTVAVPEPPTDLPVDPPSL